MFTQEDFDTYKKEEVFDLELGVDSDTYYSQGKTFYKPKNFAREEDRIQENELQTIP